MNDKIKEKFLRYEFKYLLDGVTKKNIEGELKSFMMLDPFVEKSIGHEYSVRSLYFDDPVYSFYNEKIDGVKYREKFRIRTYSFDNSPNVPIMLELKGRDNNFVFKHRTELNLGINTYDFMRGDLFKKKSKLSDKFTYDLMVKKIKPVMLIDYKRRAYQSVYDYEFRVTFDNNLYGTHTNNLFPNSNINKRALIHGYTIMEVKFRQSIPSWFHIILMKYQLNRLSISKYCTGIDSSDLSIKEDD